MDLLKGGFFLLQLLSLQTVLASDASDANTLQTAIITANAGTDTTITFKSDITLSTLSDGSPFLRPLNTTSTFSPVSQTLTIQGEGFTLSGNDLFRGLFSRGGSVEIFNLSFQNMKAQGGSIVGGTGSGGGGAGLGGSLFIATGAAVSLTNPTFSTCNATGGDGAAGLGGLEVLIASGGGGFHGSSQGNTNHGGGGGFGGNGVAGGAGGAKTNGSIGSGTTGGMGGGDFDGAGGGAGGTTSAPGSMGSSGGGGGGGGTANSSGTDVRGGDGGFGGGGGGGGLERVDHIGGKGGDGGEFGGGGGGSISQMSIPPIFPTGAGGDGGKGGFGGGGGAGASKETTSGSDGNGGNGGFGGGGGGSATGNGSSGIPGLGGFGGGNGGKGATNLSSDFGNASPSGGGGGGAGFGGAIFIQNGGALTIKESAHFFNNSVNPGLGGSSETNPGTDGQADGLDIFMMSDSTLTFDITSNVVIPNPIVSDNGSQGQSTTSGGLTKTGPAILTLNGTNTFTGTTTISEGRLHIEGSTTSPIDVESDGITSGNFTAPSITNNGTVSPGDDGLGTINIAGTYKQKSGGNLIIDITPDGQPNTGNINAGNATLEGTLTVIAKGGNYIKGTRYPVINGPTNNTTFPNLVLSGPLAGELSVRLEQGSIILVVETNLLFPLVDIKPGIPADVAKALEDSTIIPGSDLGTVVEILGTLDDKDVNAALISLSPVQFGSLELISARNTSYIANILSQHLFEICCSPRNACTCNCNHSFWVAGVGNLMDNKKTFDNLSPFTANAGGIVGGLDICSSQLYCGGSFGYLRTNINWKSHGRNHRSNGYYGALYASYQGEHTTIDASVIGNGTEYKLKRRIPFSTIDRTARSNPWSNSVTGHLGLQYKWRNSHAIFQPFALTDYHYFHRSEFRETGANSIDLHVRSNTQHLIRGEAGLQLFYAPGPEENCFSPYFGLSWVGDFPLHTSKQKANFRGHPPIMNVKSYHSSIHMISPQAGAKWTLCNGFSALFGYKGLYNAKVQIDEFDLRLEWIF